MNKIPQWPTFSDADSPMDILVKFSNYYGSDPDFILAGGGNTSMKTEESLFVKMSGTTLAEIDADGFVEMQRQPLFELLERDLGDDVDRREALFKDAVMAGRAHPETGQRPSVEVVLHNMLPSRFVIHTHSTLSNIIGCCTRGTELVEELFGDRILWVPFVDPGFKLAQKLRKGLADYAGAHGGTQPRAVIMRNHGLLIQGDTAEELRERTEWVVSRVSSRLEEAPAGDVFGAVERLESNTASALIKEMRSALREFVGAGVLFDDSETTLMLAGGAGGRDVAAGGPVTPDQIVYCKSFPMWFEPVKEELAGDMIERLRLALTDHARTTGFSAKVILVKGLGMFAVGDDEIAAENSRLLYIDAIKVMAGARRLGGIQYMTKRDREFIDNWEVENYRRQVAAAAKKTK